jgi:hypothetical protein
MQVRMPMTNESVEKLKNPNAGQELPLQPNRQHCEQKSVCRNTTEHIQKVRLAA